MIEDDDDFLARWSRRKKESRQGLSKTDLDAPAGETTETETAALADEPLATGEEVEAKSSDDPESPEETETKELTEEDFADVDFDALNYESDYGRFMKKGVPETIRRRALKQLYRSNPILANVDGLNDYDDDFTDAALAVEVLQTAYKVGRGYLTDDDIAELDEYGDDEDAELETEVAEAESDEPESRESESDEPANEEETADTDEAVDEESDVALVEDADDSADHDRT